MNTCEGQELCLAVCLQTVALAGDDVQSTEHQPTITADKILNYENAFLKIEECRSNGGVN